MRDAFQDRKRVEEARLSHDRNFTFRIKARRDRLVGLWAAGLMGMAGGGGEAYARALAKDGAMSCCEDDLVRRLLADFAAREVHMTEGRLRIRIAKLTEEAKAQLMSGPAAL